MGHTLRLKNETQIISIYCQDLIFLKKRMNTNILKAVKSVAVNLNQHTYI